MKRINEQRPKAFIGAAISVGTQLIGGIIGNRKKKKAEQAERLRQERLQNLQNNQALANAQNETIMSEEDKTQFLNQYLSKGGEMRVSPRKGAIKIVEGGTAIPIKKDSFLLKGRKHSTGGIVIDAGKTGVEAEGGEVVQVTPKQLKVFSAQPILNGESPAKLVQKGIKPSKVFNAQESFKNKNSLNDDGTIKNNKVMKLGGNRKRFPQLTGEYQGRNEGRAIRSLREARNNPNYQYQGTTSHVPNTSTKDMYDRLPLARNSRTAIEQTNRKFNTPSTNKQTVSTSTNTNTGNQSFSSAFAAARKSGAKSFNWNGRNYGTQLANISNSRNTSSIKSNKLPEVIITAPKPSNSKQTASLNTTNNKSNKLLEVTVIDSRIPKMIKDNTYVPNQYPSTNNNVTAPRESTALSLYRGIKNKLGVSNRKKLGGLSRKDDYGSSKKPYPSVKSKDFAGGGRSYPIPTKADARDALRLAGLHGRSDVRAKVYKKYPELKKASYGGSFPETVVTDRRLKKLSPIAPSFNIGNPSVDSLPVRATIDRSVMNPAGITSGAKITNPSAGSIKPMNLSSNPTSNKSGNFFSKIGNSFKGNTGELISSGIGAIGSLISGLTNKSSIDNIQAPQVPTPRAVRPARMKTNYNINPQLSEISENEKNMRRVIDSNTSSSAANISRQQRVANDAVLQRNKLRGTKENIETQLYNQDALNRQEVEGRNVAALNEAERYNSLSAAQTANEKIQAKANNRTQMIEGLISAVRDYQLGVDKKRSEENATAAMMSANPEQTELFLKLMGKNKNRLGNIRSTLFRCGGKKKIA